MGHSKASPKRKVIAIQAYLNKIETFQINNLTLHLQTGGKTTKRSQSKWKEGNNQDQTRIE